MYKFEFQAIKSLFDYRESLKESGFLQSDVDDVRNEVSYFKEVPKFLINEQILAFLIGCDGDIERSAKRIRTYYQCKRDIPEFFKNRDPCNAEIQQCLNNQYYLSLPILPSNCNLMFMCLSNFEPKNYVFDAACKTFIMLCEGYVYEKGPRPDTIFLFDMIGAKFSHALRPSISSIRRGMHFLENATPLNFKAIHILNAPSFMSYIFALVKPFTSTGILSKVHLHTSTIDWEDFYRNHIPKSHLPSDYGGDLKSIAELHEEQCEKMYEIKDYFEFEELQVARAFDEHIGGCAKDIVWQAEHHYGALNSFSRG